MSGFGTYVGGIKKLLDDNVGLVVNDYVCIEKVNTIAVVLPSAKCSHELCKDLRNTHGMESIVVPNANGVIASEEIINSYYNTSNAEFTNFEGFAKKTSCQTQNICQ